MQQVKIFLRVFFILLLFFATSCKKLIETGPPKYFLTEDKVYKDDSSAVAALLNIYAKLSASAKVEEHITSNTGMCADELLTTITGYFQFTQNAILPNDFSIKDLWGWLYAAIYSSNLLQENLERSSAISEATKKQLKGEALFIRAFCYFYLTNLWGDVPLLLTTDVRATSTAGQTPQDKVYEQIVDDLKSSQSLLTAPDAKTGKTRVTQHAATALLARTYLYMQDWIHAEKEADKIINAGLYTPLPGLNTVFLKDSREAILQWWKQNGYTGMGPAFIPPAGSIPSIQVNPVLSASFENNDARKKAWIGTTTVSGQSYEFPFKYKQRTTSNGSNAEYSVVLRCAEVYLVRAEALAHQDNIAAAINDLNVIRQRSELPELPDTLTQQECLDAIAKERRAELAFEWGHRWLDLKRTGKAIDVLGSLKPGFASTDLLFPIPQQEMNRNPRLIQNKGY